MTKEPRDYTILATVIGGLAGFVYAASTFYYLDLFGVLQEFSMPEQQLLGIAVFLGLFPVAFGVQWLILKLLRSRKAT